MEINQQVIDASKGGYQRHPESYSLRVFAMAEGEGVFYELLGTGEVIPWGAKPPTGFDFWILDVKSIHDLGVHRAGKTS